MLELDWRVHDADGVTLVEVVVESEAPTPRRVRVESRLDGPVRPPRREGVPERGWDADGYEGIVPAGGRLAVGFASPTEPTEPPVELAADERPDAELDADPDAGSGPADPMLDALVASGTADPGTAACAPLPSAETSAAGEPSPTDLLRALGSPAPPRDAVPRSGAIEGSSVGVAAAGSTRDAGSNDVAPDGTSSPASVANQERVPAPVASWLAVVEARTRRAERLADARGLIDAADAVEAAGGLGAAADLVAALAADRAALRAVARDAETLARRCEAAEEVPLDAYRRLA